MKKTNILTLGILITTCNENIKKVKKNLLPKLIKNKGVDEIIISHQIFDKKTTPEKNLTKGKIKYFHIFNNGVSKNRNNCLKYSTIDICHICDDDIIYLKDFEKIIKSEYEKNKKAKLITFEFFNERNEILKKYPSYKNHKLTNLFKFGGLEITFRRGDILKNKIKFDDDFGFSKYISGEDGIFLTDCYKKGSKMIHCKKKIGIHPSSRNWDCWSVENIEDKGAVFYRIFKWKSFLTNIYFSITKYKFYKKNLGFFKFLYLIQKGGFKYLFKK